MLGFAPRRRERRSHEAGLSLAPLWTSEAEPVSAMASAGSVGSIMFSFDETEYAGFR